MYKKWTEEDYELLRAMSLAGFSAREIHNETGWSEDTIKRKKVQLGISTRKNSYNAKGRTPSENGGRPMEYTKEQLIKIMQEAPVHTYNYFNSKESGLPAATTYRRYFGSWENALTAAGIPTNISSMKPGRPTIVYLLDFGDFYKVGITQQSLKDRFRGYPSYSVVMSIETTLEEARILEKEWLENVKEYKFVPDFLPAEGRGATECFRFE